MRKIIFPGTLISFSEGLDGVAQRTMLALYRVALRIVRRCRRLPDAERGNNFKDQVTHELGNSVTVYLVTDPETGKDLYDQFVNLYLRIGSRTGKGF
jgi:hypothetical protein